MLTHSDSCRCLTCQLAARDPSPAEIRRACLRIQRTWTTAERLKRMGAYRPRSVAATFVNTRGCPSGLAESCQ